MLESNDAELRNTVIRRLHEDAYSDIGVSVREGVVTLTGFVHYYAIKILAEEVTKSVYGIRSVANEIRLEPWPAWSTIPQAADADRPGTLTGIEAT